MALTCEMGLYFDFQNNNGFPTGCPGFAEFDGSQTEYWRQAERNAVRTRPYSSLDDLQRF